jgi:hypothetical protein
MLTGKKDTAKFKLAVAADLALYSLPENEIKAITKRISLLVKQLIDGTSNSEGKLFQFAHKHLVVLLRTHPQYLEVIDIVNDKVYRPHESFKPQVL